MSEIREKLVSLWAKIKNREIVQNNFWFLKNSSWVDIDVIGIKPGKKEISLYNVKANLNTGSKTYKAETIANNFADTINALNKAFNDNFIYNTYLIFESADLFGSRRNSLKSFKGWLEQIENKRNDYIVELKSELRNREVGDIKNVVLKSLYECIQEIINEIETTTTGGHCFKFENQIYLYPFHKISEFKILDIITDYNLKELIN